MSSASSDRPGSQTLSRSDPPHNSASTPTNSIFNSLSNFNWPSFRLPGDGLDHRRPAMSSAARDVIDLTNDDPVLEASRQPRNANAASYYTSQSSHATRLQRDIIDLDNDNTRATINSTSQSPDLEVLEVRPIRSHPAGDRDRESNTDRSSHNRVRTPLRPPEASAHRPTYGVWDSLRQHARGREPDRQSLPNAFHQFLRTPQPDSAREIHFLHDRQGILLPGDLDFITQGFPMGDAPRRQPQPAPPTYDAPSPARTGYTRSPREEDVLVCPNCEEELGSGKDDLKRQVWVIRACGHVRLVNSAADRRLTSFRSIVENAQKTGILEKVKSHGLLPERSHSPNALWRVVAIPRPLGVPRLFSKSTFDANDYRAS